MKRFFFNETEGRLRAGWRILVFIVALVACNLAVLNLIEVVIGGRPEPGPIRTFLPIVVTAVTISLLLAPARRWLDKRDVRSLGLRWDRLAVKDLLFGWLLSGVMAGLFFVVVWQLGYLQLDGFAWQVGPWVGGLAAYFGLHVVVGYWEELFFRGYLFDNMAAGLGTLWAIALSCVLYGAVHMVNPNASLLSGSIIVLFGFMRLYGLLSTRQLWLSMGMHMGWNFFQGPVFGFAASGHETFQLFTHTTTGPSWLTGGAFGPEGSVLLIPILLLALGAMYLWSTRIQPGMRTAAAPARGRSGASEAVASPGTQALAAEVGAA